MRQDGNSLSSNQFRTSTSFAGKLTSASCSTASSESKTDGSPITTTVLSPASISIFATPGSDCNVDVTVARQWPQVIEGHVYFTSATALVAVASLPTLVVSTVGPGSAQPKANVKATRAALRISDPFLKMLGPNVARREEDPEQFRALLKDFIRSQATSGIQIPPESRCFRHFRQKSYENQRQRAQL